MSKTVAKADRPTYLANVLSIAKMDGDVAGTESLVLRSVIRSIGASQEDVVAAGTLLGSGGYKMRLPKGAGGQVTSAAKKFVTTNGPDELSRVAKMHFANTKKVIPHDLFP